MFILSLIFFFLANGGSSLFNYSIEYSIVDIRLFDKCFRDNNFSYNSPLYSSSKGFINFNSTSSNSGYFLS